MKKIIVFNLILISLSIKSQNFVEVNNTDIINLYRTAISFGDYDNDKDLDLFISGRDSLRKWHSKIYRNDYGDFTDINADILGLSLGAMADWGDYDKDGDLDLLVSGVDSLFDDNAKIYMNDNGIFTDINAGLPGFIYLNIVKWGDYNGDGKSDILLSGWCEERYSDLTIIYKNVIDSFVETSIEWPAISDQNSTGWVDFDGDGDLDIYLPGQSGSFASIYNNNNDTFSILSTNIQITGEGGYADWVDFDNDGDMDVAIMGLPLNYTAPGFIESGLPIAKIYRNDTNSFVDIDAGLPGLFVGMIKWIDFNIDGHPDIFLFGKDLDDNLYINLYQNDTGKFNLTQDNFTKFVIDNAAIGDFNNDNSPDIIVTGRDSLDNPVTKLYKNTIENKIYTSKSFICDTTDTISVSYAGDTSIINNFIWDFNGGEVLDGSENGPIIVRWNTIGIKNIQLIIEKDPGENDTLKTNINVYPKIDVSIGNDTVIGLGETITLSPEVEGGTRPFMYFWNDISGDSTKSYEIFKDTIVNIKVKDLNGCLAKGGISINVPENSYPEQICLITIDNISNKNKIVWERTSDKGIKEYNILKETTIGGSYSEIETVSFNELSVFIDEDSEPNQRAHRYKLETIDSSGYKIGESDFHQTIHLVISPGLPGTYNLIWTPYIGFDYGTYYIYKGNSPDNMQLIDSVANSYNQYTDTAAGMAYYQIAVMKDGDCLPSELKKTDSGPYSQAVSNIEYNSDIAYKIQSQNLNSLVNIYPIPAKNKLCIEYLDSESGLVNIEILSLTGQKLFETKTNISRQHPYIINLEDITYSSNMYFVKITVNKRSYYKKVILE